jgi:hypothetical protein
LHPCFRISCETGVHIHVTWCPMFVSEWLKHTSFKWKLCCIHG